MYEEQLENEQTGLQQRAGAPIIMRQGTQLAQELGVEARKK